MAYKPVYLEPDEEITSVIDKIAQSSDKEIALVLAKNSGLFQSLVNLKLVAKEAKKQGKTITLVTTNKIGQRLAGQVGIKTYGAITAIPSTPQPAGSPVQPTTPALPDQVIDGVKVQQYDPNRQHKQMVEEDQQLEKELAKDEPAAAAEPTNDGEVPKVFEPTTVKPEALAVNPQSESRKLDDLPAIMSRSGGFNSRKEFKIPWKSVAVGFGVLLFIIILVVVFVPRAIVTITYLAEPLSEKVNVSAVNNLKEQKANTIAGNKLSVEKTKSEKITATGQKDVGTDATGKITIINKHTDGSGVGKDQTFSAGTKATHSGGKVFTLNESVTIGKVTYDPNNGQPIYKSKVVEVTAVEPGESYNVASGSFSVAGALSNTPASSSTAFTGGLTKVVTVLSQDDIDSALLKLNKTAKEEATKELTEKAAGQKILSDAIWADIKQEDADKDAGEEVSSATATLIVEYGVVVFDENQALEIFIAAFDNRINDNERVVFPDDNKPVFTTKKITKDKNQIDFEIAGVAFKVPNIDKTRISKSIKNKSREAASAIVVEQYDAQSAEVSISPSWWINRLPLLAKEIRIEYGFIDKTKTN
ncbi:MAG: hypothetical protein WD544_00935 [Patescibacteria group bacterium]